MKKAFTSLSSLDSPTSIAQRTYTMAPTFDEKRSGSPAPNVDPADKNLARDLPLNTDSESATVLDDTSEYMMNAKREGINPAFMAKVVVLNKAMAELGMGRYQWELFFTSGFGWMADNLCRSTCTPFPPAEVLLFVAG